MTDLIRLAERVEKLTGRDREVDLEIYRAIYPFPCVALSERAQDAFDREKAPKYSASLDAAMTLVPEGFKWRCGYSRHVPHNAEVVDYNSHKGTFIGESDSNRACALTAASLRSLAAQRGQS